MTNRLAREKSPYLLQHAHNPVDWYPWGDEAFEKAAREDKPVFLSIGYSTCHWCHVMEHESFENEDIARLLNDHFVSIKVDREERPDVDRIYMLFVQASTGSGGWPMSVWLTPERKPFFGGTYFPPENRYGRPGFAAILQSLAHAWRSDRARIEESGAQVLGQLREYSGVADGAGEPSRDSLNAGFLAFRRAFDPRRGGFGGAPKFPRPSVHDFLLRYFAETHEEEARDMVLLTLREMAKGGIHDQLGGGFHRYSVDERWFVPHFEKMLYDQAQLAVSYVEAFQTAREPLFADTARDILEYVLRDLGAPEGGFYSAEDADSEDPAHPGHKSEGAFYLWTRAELVAALGSETAAMFSYRYGAQERGNVAEDPHGEFEGGNLLFETHTIEETADRFGGREQVEAALRDARATLLNLRAKRPRPHLDDKILAAWNGQMIGAFAKAARILNEDRYEQAARRAADFLRAKLWREADATLLRRYRAGEAAIEGFLDDYAYLALGLIELYQNSFESRDLAWASRLVERAMELFEDKTEGGFFSTAEAKPDLVLRLKDDYDGAEPSGNSGIALALLRLAGLTGRADFRAAADRALRAFAQRLRTASSSLPQMLSALALALGKPMEIVLAGPRDHPEMRRMLEAIRENFLPQALVLRAEDSPIPMPAVGGGPTAYVCENYACQLPAVSADALRERLPPAAR